MLKELLQKLDGNRRGYLRRLTKLFQKIFQKSNGNRRKNVDEVISEVKRSYRKNIEVREVNGLATNISKPRRGDVYQPMVQPSGIRKSGVKHKGFEAREG
jgi:hypothetical protein